MTDNNAPRYVTDEAELLDEIKGLLEQIRTVLVAALGPAPRSTSIVPVGANGQVR
jgi:hypothetical protein